LQLSSAQGPFRIRYSNLLGGVVRGKVSARRSNIYGVLSGHDDRPIDFDNLELPPLEAYHAEDFRVSVQPPPNGKDGPAMLRVFDKTGAPRGGQIIDVTWDRASGQHILDPAKPLNIRLVGAEQIDPAMMAR
jgi:hypothetical protein